MGRVSTYTTIEQVAEDPQCVEILTTASGSRSARAAGVYSAVFKMQFEGVAARWIGTGKEAEHVFEQPYGYVALAVLTFFAEKKMQITGISEANDEGLIEAVLPRNFLSVEGQIAVKLRADEFRVITAAAVKVPGQMYDWGRSKRTLAKLFEAVDTHVATFHQRDL
jgi:hypothetical protein